MPSSLAHYALGAAVVTPFGFTGRQRALLALFAVAPDLDVVTAVVWFLVAPTLDVGADAIRGGTYLFAHRGFTHSLLSAPLVVGAALWWRGGDRRWALAAGAAWSSQVLLDALTPWRVVPFWPATTWATHLPLVTSLDPVLTVLALVATLALLAQTELPRWLRASPERHDRWWAWGRRWAMPAVAATLLVLPLAAANIALTAERSDAAYADVHPVGLPATVAVFDDGDAWRIERRWHPWDAPDETRVPKLDDRHVDRAIGNELAHARCVLEQLGPYDPIDHAAWRASEENGTLTLHVVDAVRNATREGGPALAFTFEGRTLTGVRLTGTDDDGGGRLFEVRVPQVLVEDARCPG